MKIEGFLNINIDKTNWAFYAISLDYLNGNAIIFFHLFDGVEQPRIKNFTLSYPEFELSGNAELVFAGVENNPYFQSTSGYIGNIWLTEMAAFYTTKVDQLWAGFMPQSSFAFKNVILEFLFTLYETNNIIYSSVLNKEFAIVGIY